MTPHPKSEALPTVYWCEWIDSCTTRGWQHPSEMDNDDDGLRCWTIGFLVEETDVSITLAESYSAHGAFNCPLTIPRVAIIKLQECAFHD
jgi:hypothetical protein